MADNFNLRSFLTENRLTKNAQLLKEEKNSEVEENMDEAKGYSFTLTYNDPKYVQKVLDDAGVDAFAKAGTFDDEIIIRAFNAMGLRRAKQALEADHFDIDENIEEAAPSAGMTAKEKSALVKKAKHGEDIGKKGAGFEKVEKAAEKKYGSKEAGEKVAAAAMWKNAAKHEGVNEAREAYLIGLVENALGLDTDDMENDSSNDDAYAKTFDTMEEGEEMVQENPLPKYKNIDELMSNIEHGTNEAAHKYKMERMKEVAEALEAKVTSLEEGENAEHIDQKAVKQMRKDILALRKAEEKLRKEFDKKFASKKEAKEDK